MLSQLIPIVQQAGQMMLSAHDFQVIEKEGIGNFVTTYDLKIQQFLQEHLLNILPDAQFIGEEEKTSKNASQGWAFIVDPIDGTSNFVHGFHASVVSVGLIHDGSPVAGIVYNPFRDETFSAQVGHGATLNHKPIHVSNRSMKQGIFCFGTSPYQQDLRIQSMVIANRLMNEMQDLRRSGSAAIDLCDVACGRADLAFECILQPWDYAASALIITEAGGCISQLDGNAITFDRPCSIVCGNKITHSEFLQKGLAQNI